MSHAPEVIGVVGAGTMGAGIAQLGAATGARTLLHDHPRGPFAWCEAIGVVHVLAVLDALRIELGEERYRAAPMLRRMAAEAAEA